MIINYLLHGIAINENLNTKKIVNKLRKAKYAIWMINGKNWLTDEHIYPLLLNHLNEGVNIEIVMNDYILSDYENAKLQMFIDAGSEIFLIDNKQLEKPLNERYCIIDYSSVANIRVINNDELKPHQGSEFIKENRETLIENYIDEYLYIKNTFCKNRY